MLNFGYFQNEYLFLKKDDVSELLITRESKEIVPKGSNI